MSKVFKNFKILTGSFLVPSYESISFVNDLSIQGVQDQEQKGVFTLFSSLYTHGNDSDLKAGKYEYYLFFPDEEIVRIVRKLEKTFEKNSLYMIFFFFWAILQLAISFIMIRFISH